MYGSKDKLYTIAIEGVHVSLSVHRKLGNRHVSIARRGVNSMQPDVRLVRSRRTSPRFPFRHAKFT
eukprot:1332392-Amorphochlora_amoeboformis.AAC.1